MSAQGVDVPGPAAAGDGPRGRSSRLRVSGMQGLLDTFKATKADDSKDAIAAGEKLAAQARRLDASDVVWQVLFRAPAQATLQDEGLGDITAPASVFVENVELYTAKSMTAIWLRVHGASTGGSPSGVHGTGLEKVVVQPAGTQLAPDTETTIKASTDLAFDVSVKNTGENQEVGVEVTLTIPKGTTPIVKKQTIDLLDIGEVKTVTFKDFPDPPFGEKTSVQVSVKPVQGETEHGEQQRRVSRHLLARVMDAALAVASAACAVAVVALLLSLCSRAGCAGSRAPRRRCSAERPTTWSTLPSRFRAASTISTGRSTRSRRGCPASTGASTERSPTPPSSGMTPTRTPEASSLPRSRSSTRPGREPSSRRSRAATTRASTSRTSSGARPRWRSRRRSRRPSSGPWDADAAAARGFAWPGRATSDGSGGLVQLSLVRSRHVHQVLVLNASYEPLNVCSDRRAHVLVWKGKAEVVEHHAEPLRSAGARSSART